MKANHRELAKSSIALACGQCVLTRKGRRPDLASSDWCQRLRAVRQYINFHIRLPLNYLHTGGEYRDDHDYIRRTAQRSAPNVAAAAIDRAQDRLRGNGKSAV